MCGIAGRYGVRPIDAGHADALARGMQHALRSRGPDGGRAYHDGDVLLVHRRLSIIDLSDAATQPLWNEDASVCVLVNGEVYNFVELRGWLEARGHRFRSRSDSEVLVHLYEEGGIEHCCAAASGMFAFALWDARSRELFLVRDRLGIKPLVMAEHQDGVTFASTLHGLLADPSVPRGVRSEALRSVLIRGFVPAPWSALHAARRVLPGTWLRVRSGRVVEERRWWTDAPPTEAGTDAEVRGAIEAAVRSHLVADVPVGALLSAGIDSGIVTALAARCAGRDGLEAWTVSHRGHPEDEFPEASLAASHFGVRLHEAPLGERGLTAEGFAQMVAAMDEPLSDPSLIGLHTLFAAIAPGRRVVLSGDGGDELFAGYDWHAAMPALPTWSRSRSFRAVAPGLSWLRAAAGRAGALGSVAALTRRHPASVYLDRFRISSDDELRRCGIESAGAEVIEQAAAAAWERHAGRGLLEQMLAVDRATLLADQMLAKVDTASMAHSVESRVPLLADAVLAAAKALPSASKRRGEMGKLCLREWYSEIGPAALAQRRKTGFNSPLGVWLAGQAGGVLREYARDGVALLGGRGEVTTPAAVFAAAVVGAWAAHLREPAAEAA